MKLFEYTIKELKTLLDKALSVDNSSDFALDKEMQEHSREHGKWAAYYAKAQKLYRLMELDLETITAEVAAEIRQRAKEDGKPLAATAPVYKEMVPTDKRWKDAKTNLIKMQEYVDILGSIDRAFNNRAWLMIRLAKNRDGTLDPHAKGQQRGSSKPVEMEEYEM